MRVVHEPERGSRVVVQWNGAEQATVLTLVEPDRTAHVLATCHNREEARALVDALKAEWPHMTFDLRPGCWGQPPERRLR